MAYEEKLFQTSGKLQATNSIKGLKPIKDHVIVTDMDFGNRKLSSGIVLLNDDGKSEGIRPRWAKVYKVGPEQQDVKEGQWIFIEHGRWTRGLKVEIDGTEFTVRRVDSVAIIGVQDEQPSEDDTISTAVVGASKKR
jgi:co-chaperonin GroES (HSP10)